jgi:hypothetical protein
VWYDLRMETMTGMKPTTFKRTGYIGRDADGGRVYLTIELTPQTGTSNTIEHKPITSWTRASFTGHSFYKGSRRYNFDAFGTGFAQTVVKPAPGITLDDLAQMARLEKRWHLNDLRAGCAHQTIVYGINEYGRKAPSSDDTPACPETGYRYGHAWLVEPLPADAEAEIRELAELLDGEDGIKHRP